jgi:hypothetical protein
MNRSFASEFSRWSELNLYGADLDRRLGVRVIGNVTNDLRGMRRPRLLKRLDRFKAKVSQRKVWRRRAGRGPGDPFLYSHIFESWVKKLLDHWNVLGAVVGHIKMVPWPVRIEDTHFDHKSLSVECKQSEREVTQL